MGLYLCWLGIPVYLFMMLQNNKKDKVVDELKEKCRIGYLVKCSTISSLTISLFSTDVLTPFNPPLHFVKRGNWHDIQCITPPL
jgi:hypothetical protein